MKKQLDSFQPLTLKWKQWKYKILALGWDCRTHNSRPDVHISMLKVVYSISVSVVSHGLHVQRFRVKLLAVTKTFLLSTASSLRPTQPPWGLS